ncbi:MAG: hypothetical protein B6D35_06350 [Candidatus Brocadia sp. UTAMX2]|jgi:septal ring factor EnvC (AmiA/AmiB activator)|nr:MAG: hypothetical protein B6D35_06350 [Candidatus Brocadia sp. UTAMX2]
MEALIGLIVIIIAVCSFIKYQRKKEKELTPYERQKQVEEMAKGVEELISEVVQESDYGKKTNEEIEHLKNEIKQLQKELSKFKKDDHEKQNI